MLYNRCFIMTMLCFALNFRYRLHGIVGDMRFMVTFGSMGLLWVRSSHSCFCHRHTSLDIAVFHGLFFCIAVLILIFLCNGCLPICFFHTTALIVRLAVFWHYNSSCYMMCSSDLLAETSKPNSFIFFSSLSLSTPVLSKSTATHFFCWLTLTEMTPGKVSNCCLMILVSCLPLKLFTVK